MQEAHTKPSMATLSPSTEEAEDLPHTEFKACLGHRRQDPEAPQQQTVDGWWRRLDLSAQEVRQGFEFQASLNYLARFCLKKTER